MKAATQRMSLRDFLAAAWPVGVFTIGLGGWMLFGWTAIARNWGEHGFWGHDDYSTQEEIHRFLDILFGPKWWRFWATGSMCLSLIAAGVLLALTGYRAS